MLVLSRRAGEENNEIVIGQGDGAVVIKVIEIRGDKVRLGIVADKSVPVHRREVYDLIHRERTNET